MAKYYSVTVLKETMLNVLIFSFRLPIINQIYQNPSDLPCHQVLGALISEPSTT